MRQFLRWPSELLCTHYALHAGLEKEYVLDSSKVNGVQKESPVKSCMTHGISLAVLHMKKLGSIVGHGIGYWSFMEGLIAVYFLAL